jgi:signal transduction histidine kinase
MNDTDADTGRRVLIAEDSKLQAAVLSRTLTAAGYRVETAYDGREALARASASVPDLVITDVLMPALDGFGLCRALRTDPATASVPILLLTSLADVGDVLEGLAAGADDYLIKPWDDRRLLAKVAEMLTATGEETAPSALEHGAATIDFDHGGQHYHIPFRPRAALRLLTSTYAHAIGQNRELTAAREEIRLANQELERKVAERTMELSAANRRLEDSLRQLYSTEDALIQSEKLTAVGAMVGSIVHEINNPIMAAMNYVQYAIEEVADPQLKEYLRSAEGRIRQISKLTDSMLHYVRRDERDLEAVDPLPVIDETLVMMAPELKTHGVEVQRRLPATLPAVAATRIGLQQVLANLLKNAVDAMAETVERRIVIDAEADRGAVRLRVEDSGPGIPEGLREQIFEAFFTTKPKGKGTGLGLAICQRILRACGGRLDCESTPAPDRPGTGARFVISLRPATAAGAALGPAAPAGGA